jgi:hypothetical protein
VRKAKLKKFRKAYAAAKTGAEKQAIQQKVFRISPFAVLEETSK